jgi:hypothetical protein
MVRALLRVEGLAVFGLSVCIYAAMGDRWLWFVLLFLAPDLSMLGYLGNPRVGSICYNLVHTYAAPITLLGIGQWAHFPVLIAAGLILAAHIGLDRFLGFGLKYPTRFKDTHIQRV